VSSLSSICNDNLEFSKELNELLYFPISDIVPEKPYGWMPQWSVLAPEIIEVIDSVLKGIHGNRADLTTV